jgi:carboxyl-terminal processing protease
MRNKKLQVWLPLVFSIVMIVGMFFGYKLGKQGNAGDFFASNKRSSLQEALDLIRLRYVDSINIDSLEGKAIQEMMTELDPHSVYFPPVELREANEDLAGNFDGIGVEFNIYGDTVNVVFVIPGGPSEKSGLRIGDKIMKVDDSLLVGRKLTVSEIKDRIRGKRGSKANLQVLREGKIILISIVRGSIPVPSIDAVYMIDKTTGYIRLTKFTDKSYEEFMDAMENLKKQGMQSLVYDLRGNGGGFMNEAVDMADEFLDGNKLIVYTEGVNSRKKEYRCKRAGIFETGNLVVLVDELSASASEVLAGALQDWCRAKIIGRRTFGKGLVQEQYSLSDGSAIRLTVARYYTPIGRSIQRSYEHGKKIYMDELWERFSNGEVLSADSAKRHNGKAYPTACKDTVYGGDGITPNFFVPLDTLMLRSSSNSFDPNLGYFVYKWYVAHAKQMEQYSNSADYTSKFNIDPMWDDFLVYADSTKAKAAGLTAQQKQSVQRLMKALLARYRWRNTGFYKVLNEDDPAVSKAVEVLHVN